MIAPILATKFYIPTLRSDLAPRPRLVRKLSDGLAHPLVLISAPAGFGKTTLIAEWHASPVGRDFPLIWLSLEPEERDPLRFLNCLAAALEPLQPGIWAEVEELSHSVEPLKPKDILARLIQELNSLSNPFALVLEDYHSITGRTIHDIVAYLISHMPTSMRLILSSRSDPPLPLSRLRLSGDLIEIRADDLRFTREETEAYLNQIMGLALSIADIAALEIRTEGWIAGLKLAALSMLNNPQADFSAFVSEFAGSHRYIADYLVEEVLNGQPDQVRSFLLQTSVLSLLGGPLCDAVTGQRNGQAMLEQLDQENLFVIRLDDERCWFRYHHLFADLLRHHLDQIYPGLAPELHRRAVAWYEQNELLECAIDEALDAGEFEIAVDLMKRAYPAMLENGQAATLARWRQALPARLLQADRKLAALLPTLTKQTLTPRELEVIRLIGAGASNQVIAQSLVVSLGTVKKHLNNIFIKLEAQNRTQAVTRARELGLL